MKVQTDVKAGGLLNVDIDIDIDVNVSLGGGCGHRDCKKSSH